nr:1-aminocyclopropane-1-carboxylate synthase-like [Tanacetum cinerariifolium]
MGLAENQLCFDLIQEWVKNNPQASICTPQGGFDFKEIAIYQDYHGLPEFTEAIANFMSRVRGSRVKFNPSRIVMSGGATGAYETVAFCLVNPGEGFLVATPYYPGIRLAHMPDLFTKELAQVRIGSLESNAGLIFWMDLRRFLKEPTFESEMTFWRTIIDEIKLKCHQASISIALSLGFIYAFVLCHMASERVDILVKKDEYDSKTRTTNGLRSAEDMDRSINDLASKFTSMFIDELRSSIVCDANHSNSDGNHHGTRRLRPNNDRFFNNHDCDNLPNKSRGMM